MAIFRIVCFIVVGKNCINNTNLISERIYMPEISGCYGVNFNGCIHKQNKSENVNTKIPDLPSDSIEITSNNSVQLNFLDRVKNFFSIAPEIKYKNFISTAEKKMAIASLDFEEIYKNSQNFYEEACELMHKTKNKNFDNIRTYGTSYKGEIYRTIAKIDENGFINKIIQTKNGEIHTIYDIKSQLKAGKNRIYDGEPTQKITADCYFYDNDKDKIGYMKNITNNVSEFNASCDFENGGAKRVNENKDKSPVEVYAEGSDEQTYTYRFNYGESEDERVSRCNFGDAQSRIKYTITEPSMFTDRLNSVKSYFEYKNIVNRPEHRLVIFNPVCGIEDYDLYN